MVAAAATGHALAQTTPEAAIAQAETLLRDGDPGGALALYDSAIASGTLSARDLAIAEGGAGLALVALGRRNAALSRMFASGAAAEALGADDVAATTAYNFALTLLEPGSSLARPATASAEARSSGDRALIGGPTTEFIRASDTFAYAAALAERAGRFALAARAYAAAVATRVSSRRPDRLAGAVEDLEAAVAAVAAAPAGADRLRAALAVGDAGVDLLKATDGPQRGAVLERTYHALEIALRDALEQRSVALESRARGALGALYAESGRYLEATRLTEDAIAMAEAAAAFDALFRWQGQLAAIRRAEGDQAGAVAAYRRSLASIERARAAIAGSGDAAQAQAEEIVTAFADLLLKTDEPANILEARDAVDRLKALQLDRFFGEMCAIGFYGEPAPLEDVDPDTAILYPIIFEDRIDLVLTAADGFVARRSSAIDRRRVSTLVRRAIAGMTRPAPTDGPLAALGELYAALIAPIEADLASIGADTILFVPDDALRGLPLAALHDGEGFLVERYAVGATLGLSLIDRRQFDREAARAVLAGVTDALTIEEGSAAVPFSSLPAVGRELDGIAATLRSRVLLNEEFTKENFERAVDATPINVLHVASHASFGARASSSFLLAHGGADGAGARIGIDELSALAKAAESRGEPIELMTLSACDTGIGRADAGENALLGLAGAAYRSGARSVLASLWQVNDESTSRLMRLFYEALLGDADADGGAAPMSKAKALQSAQRVLIADPARRHPNYWAAFVLVGNWL